MNKRFMLGANLQGIVTYENQEARDRIYKELLWYIDQSTQMMLTLPSGDSIPVRFVGVDKWEEDND